MKRRQCTLVSVLALLFLIWPLICFAADSAEKLKSYRFPADDLASAFKDGKTSGFFRVRHFAQDCDYTNPVKLGPADSKTSVFGGTMSYETAPLVGFSLGAGLRTQHEIINYDDDDYASYFNFFPRTATGTDTSGLNGVNEAFLRYNQFDTLVTVGRQMLDTPYMKFETFRLLPQAHQGVLVKNTSLNDWEFNLGYFNRFVDWMDGDFRDMISPETFEGKGWKPSAPIRPSENAMFGGAAWKPVQGLDMNAWYYLFTNTYTLWSPQVKYSKTFNKDLRGFIDFRYAKWDETGDKFIGDVYTPKSAGKYDTDMKGFVGNINYKMWTFMAGVQQNGDGDLLEPFGPRRIVTQSVERSTRADETAYILHLAYKFDAVGVKGLSTTVRYGIYDNADGVRTSATAASDLYANQDFTELNLIAKYDFARSLKGLSLQACYSIVDKDESEATMSPNWWGAGGSRRKNTADCNDIRLYLDYAF